MDLEVSNKTRGKEMEENAMRCKPIQHHTTQQNVIRSTQNETHSTTSLTCSLTTGLTSYALTTAPMLLAVPIDARPATPAPIIVYKFDNI